MNGMKGFFESKAVWGGIIGMAASGLSLGHFSVSAADQATVIELVTGLPGLVGSLLAIYGRVVASKVIA
jgi:hypothetical protein